MLSYVLFLIYISAKVTVVLLLIFVTLAIAGRLLLEPFKGVCKCNTKLHGKTVLITGGNSGIGLETARDLARRGARVIIASRNIKKSEEAVANIKETTGNDNVEYKYLNLAKKDSIVKFTEDFKNEFERLDILVNNAGAFKTATTKNGIDLLMQINYVGPFMLTHLLLDKLFASKPSRIVNVSSYLHNFARFDVEDLVRNKSNNTLIRYANTKLCDILWTRALAKKLPNGVTANVLHPGLVKTNIFFNIHPYIKSVLFFIIDLFFKTPLEGAKTTIHLCVSSELENASGGYYMDCRKIRSSKTAENEYLGAKLWDDTLDIISDRN